MGSRVAGKDVAWFMADESEPLERTWMAFCADEAVWGDQVAHRHSEARNGCRRTPAGSRSHRSAQWESRYLCQR